jgi:hypothetical protein
LLNSVCADDEALVTQLFRHVVSLFAQGPWQVMMPTHAVSLAQAFDCVQQPDVTQVAHDADAYPIPQAVAAAPSPLLPSSVLPSVPPSRVPHWVAQLVFTQELNPSVALTHAVLPVSVAVHVLELAAVAS